MENIHETKNATPLVNGSAATCDTARHRAAILPHHAVLIEFNSISAALDVRQRTLPQAV
jgi:uncharacterized ferritin-like protein (DUF455 family)